MPNFLGLSSQQIDTEMEELHTASSKKIKLDHQFDSEIHEDFFFLMHTSILFHLLAVVGVCPDYHSDKLILYKYIHTCMHACIHKIIVEAGVV